MKKLVLLFSVLAATASLSQASENSFSSSYRPKPIGGQACFYKDANLGGARLCLERGMSVSYLNGDWNDKITSIRIDNSIWGVYMCTDGKFSGTCVEYTADDNDSLYKWVGGGFNDKFTSIYVY